jgi:hypothetical protein
VPLVGVALNHEGEALTVNPSVTPPLVTERFWAAGNEPPAV